ncbi:MAG: DsrE family protein [Saprospiraceae bacterium]
MKTKYLITASLMIFWTLITFSQSTTSVNKTKYKIVMQLASPDTVVHHNTVTQIYNAMAEAPNSTIELVCHSAGISFLQMSKTVAAKDIEDLKKKGVVFAACANTIRMRKIDKADIVSQAIIVPSGVIEIVDKQSKGWQYLKAGN